MGRKYKRTIAILTSKDSGFALKNPYSMDELSLQIYTFIKVSLSDLNVYTKLSSLNYIHTGTSVDL